jgi:predicted RNase H-like HicB family nuclease
MRSGARRSSGVTERRYVVDIIVEPGDGEFHAYAPALKGLHVGGDTEDEALKNAMDAAVGYIETLIEYDRPIPVGIVDEPDRKKPSRGASRHRQEFTAVA